MAERRRPGTASGDLDRFPQLTLVGNPVLETSLSDAQRDRIRLRQRWELASVLNFLRVFRPVIPKDLKVSAEDLEMALITANEDLGHLHIAILKGIPPISKSIRDPDSWITLVCKKLATWWSWVAEGEIPLKVDHGKEIFSYKQFDPITRLLILKALCEVRAEQDDILGFIADELKSGTKVDSFRMGKLGSSVDGITYWYEGDSVIGHRLYKEIGLIDSKQKAKEKGSAVKPTFDSQWETIATNVEEFRGVADTLSLSQVPGEASIGDRIKTEILSVLENYEKKKERALQKQQRQALQLGSFLTYEVGATRSCRERRPARYTFDDYDRSIDEAIQISMEPKENGKLHKHGLGNEHTSTNAKMEPLNENSSTDEDSKGSEDKNDVKTWDKISNDDDEEDDDDEDGHDDDYDNHNDDDDDDDDDEAGDIDNTSNSDSENDEVNTASKRAHEKKHLNVKLVTGLRRSSRNSEVSNQRNFDNVQHAMTKKRLRQRPTRNAGYTEALSDSENENHPAKHFKQNMEDSSSMSESSSADSSDESSEESSKGHSL